MSKFILMNFFLSLTASVAFANFKGINFQASIKRPDGTYPTVSGLTVNVQMLSTNDCILGEESFTNVSITNGYLYLVVGKGTPSGADQGRTMKENLNNSEAFTGLTCLDGAGAVDPMTTTYAPLSGHGRKIRLSMTLDGQPLIAFFNMRSAPYAVNSETLNGKTESDFIAVNSSSSITQAKLEQFFQTITQTSGNTIQWDGTNFVSVNPAALTSSVGNSTTQSVVNTGTATYMPISEFLTPNMTTGQEVYLTLGKSASFSNAGSIGFLFRGDGGGNFNRLSLGFHGQSVKGITVVDQGGAPFVAVGVNAGGLPGSRLSVNGGLSVGSTYYSLAAPAGGMIIENNVGIGTPTPTYKLDIAGDTNISSGNALRFGGTSVCTSAGCTSSSDRRLKKNIQPLQGALEKILNLQGVEYDYKNKFKFTTQHQVGVIAQEVEKVYPEVVVTDSKTGFKSVAYDHLVAPLIEAIKALHVRIVELENRDESNERKIKDLEARLERLERTASSRGE